MLRYAQRDSRALPAFLAMPRVIALLTDFGFDDHFVGVMKGAILRIAPDAVVVDVCHQVSPQAIDEAAYLLECAHPYFPRGTIHVVVVDPGVGTERGAVAVEAAGQLFLAPDNGVLTPIIACGAARAVALTEQRFWLGGSSATFDGLIVFAPTAAHLARGVGLDELGPPIAPKGLVRLPSPEVIAGAPELVTRIVHVDHYGSLVTEVTHETLDVWLAGRDPAGLTIEAGPATIVGLSRIFSDVAPSEPLALWGSGGRLEVAVNGGSAAAALGLGRNDDVRVGWHRAA